MNVAIIGCGLIGRKRALALNNNDKLLACCDVDKDLAKKFASEFSCQPFLNYRELFTHINCDAIIVAVVNKFECDIVVDALKLGINVLAEKPLGRNVDESRKILSAWEKWNSGIIDIRNNGIARNCNNENSNYPTLHKSNHTILKTGFNHRFHPAIWKAKNILDQESIGKVINIRARYGHGGRIGMEKEWRASKELCGGGELLDQGVHIIDLIRWFGGDIAEVYGKVETKFWNMEVEDNASAILKTKNDVTATFNVSWTNWKNIFCFEIFGTGGYLKVEGLGGSYGTETLEYGKRKKESGRPDIELFEMPQEDISWKDEWTEFKNAIAEGRLVIADGYDGLKANEIVAAIYESSFNNSIVQLN